MCWRPNFTFGTLVLGAFPFGAFTFSTFTFITLLPINLALLGANLFSRFVLIEPFKGLFNIIFICVFILVHVFIPILGNRGFPFGTMLHSTDLAFLGSVTIDPFTSIFRSIFTFGFKFINVFGILFRTVFKSIEIFIPSVMVCLVRLICMPPTISNHLQPSPTLSAYTPVSLRYTLRKLAQPHHSCRWTKLGSMSNFPGLCPYVSGHHLFVFFSICHICLMHFH